MIDEMKKYDKEGKEISFIRWMELFEDRDYRQVDRTMRADGIEVSTIWLGIPHGGMLFETATEANSWEPVQRYKTIEQARLGHQYWTEADLTSKKRRVLDLE